MSNSFPSQNWTQLAFESVRGKRQKNPREDCPLGNRSNGSWHLQVTLGSTKTRSVPLISQGGDKSMKRYACLLSPNWPMADVDAWCCRDCTGFREGGVPHFPQVVDNRFFRNGCIPISVKLRRSYRRCRRPWLLCNSEVEGCSSPPLLTPSLQISMTSWGGRQSFTSDWTKSTCYIQRVRQVVYRGQSS